MNTLHYYFSKSNYLYVIILAKVSIYFRINLYISFEKILSMSESLHLIIRNSWFEFSSNLFFVLIFLMLFLFFSQYCLIEEYIDSLESREESTSLFFYQLIANRDKSNNISIPIRYYLRLTLRRENSKNSGDIMTILISNRCSFEK